MDNFFSNRFSRDIARAKEDLNDLLSAFEQDPSDVERFRSAADRILESAAASFKRWQEDRPSSFSSSSEEEDDLYISSKMKPANKKRLRKKAKAFDPCAPVQEEDDEEIFLDEPDIIPDDEDDCRQFLDMVREEDYTLPKFAWFDQRYGFILEMVRTNLGRQGSNEPGLAFWDLMSSQALRNGNTVNIKMQRRKRQTCNLCNLTRTCSFVIAIGCDQFTLGEKCANLAIAGIEFFKTLRSCADDFVSPNSAIEELDGKIIRIQEAHAAKSN